MTLIDKVDLQAYGLDSSAEQLIKSYLTTRNVLILVALYVGVQRMRWLASHLWVRSQVKGLHTIHSAVEVFEAGHRSKLPHIPGLIPANDYTITEPWKKYEKARSDLIACTQWTTDYPVYITANPHVAASVAAKTSIFHKPLSMFRYVAINCFGDQIVSMQTGAPHNRHKGVIKGCFGEDIMKGAWTKMEEAFETMVVECDIGKGGVLQNIEETLVILTLIVIGEMGFGVKFPWTIEKTDSAILPLPEALYVVEHSMEAQLILPLWLMKYNPFSAMRRLARAQESLLHHIRALIDRRRLEIRVETAGLPKGEKIRPPTDLLGAMVASNMAHEADKTGQGLTAEELLGNVWIMIVAGHETSAHVLGFALGYLALHPEVQDKILAEVQEVCGDSAPSYRDMPSLKYTLATCYESIRLRDIVMTLPKLVVEDTVIPYTTWDAAGNITTLERPLAKGAHLIIDSPACSLNPFTWTDPDAFRPERFLDEGVKNHFTGFSSGARMCIGKRFAEVEMVCFLANFVRTFKFAPIAKEGESREELYKRYTFGSEVLNLTPGKWDLKIEKRV